MIIKLWLYLTIYSTSYFLNSYQGAHSVNLVEKDSKFLKIQLLIKNIKPYFPSKEATKNFYIKKKIAGQ